MYWSVWALWFFLILQFVVIYLLTKLVAQFLNKLQIKEISDAKKGLGIGDQAPVIHHVLSNEDVDTFSGIGDRPTLLLFTSEHCGYCKKVLAELDPLAQRHPYMRVAVFAGTAEQAAGRPETEGSIPYWYSTDAYDLYEVKGVPTALLLDKHGKIRLKATTIANSKHLQKLVDGYFAAESDSGEMTVADERLNLV